MNELATRILNAIPAAAFEMNALLSLLRIEETESVATASVSCTRRPVLRINPAFVRRHCRTDEHLFLLVMHELHHVLLGHTRLFPRASRAHNVAFDAIINAMLAARFPADTYRSFFLELYGQEDGPLRLLAPPAGTPISSGVLRPLHGLLYGGSQVTAEEVFNAITDTVAYQGEFLIQPDALLLGDHAGPDEGDWGTEGPVDPEFVRAIRAIVEKWPPPERPIRGRSLADVLTRADVEPAPPAAQVLQALRRALLGVTLSRSTRAPTPRRQICVQDAVPSASDRRAAVSRAAGFDPLLYGRSSDTRRRGRAGRAQVYLDVSGSMEEYVPLLYGALLALRNYVHTDVLLFSTTIASVRIADLQNGRVNTTGGTDITCVLEHVLKTHIRKALVITDGYVGPPAREQAAALQRVRADIRVVLTPGGWREDLKGVACRMDELPSLRKGETA